MEKPDKIKQAVRTLRRALNYEGLYEKNVPDEPFALFDAWMEVAVKKNKFEPNAMTLATVSKDGQPHARTVLLKDYSSDGFIFFTNYNSRKGIDLESNPKAALKFYWPELSRQILIDGQVEKISRKDSIEYFHSRPRSSQIAAYISNQSHVVKDRQELKSLFQKAEEEFKGEEIPCPEWWGGYVLTSSRIEFWQGRPDRLHDRLCYASVEGGAWNYERLAP